MNEILETVTIAGEKGEPVRLNKSDFDPKTHKIYEEPKKGKEAEKEPDSFDRAAAFETLKAAGVNVAKNATNDKLQEALAGLGEGSQAKVFKVEAKDDKFVIVDGEGNQVGDAYETQEAADSMLKILAPNT